jgi:hypothetical protein
LKPTPSWMYFRKVVHAGKGLCWALSSRILGTWKGQQALLEKVVSLSQLIRGSAIQKVQDILLEENSAPLLSRK